MNKAIFSLSNQQRTYLGLNPIEETWEEVIWKNHLYLYFEKDIIRKVIYYAPDSEEHFKEIDTYIPTNQRLSILPKTSKGKEKKLTTTSVLDYGGIGNQFSFAMYHYNTGNEPVMKWRVNGLEMGLAHNTPDFSQFKTIRELNNWIIEFITQLPDNHLDKLQIIKNKAPEKRKIVKYKQGDFFAVPYRHNLYGEPSHYVFGRLLLNMYDLRKKGLFPEPHLYAYLMTHPMLVAIYTHISETIKPDLELLKKEKMLPSFFMMDDHLLRDGYPIVGSLPIEANELSFPMHYGKSFNEKYTFTWGLLSLESDKNIQGVHPLDYNHCGVSFGTSFSLLEEYLQNRPPYYPKVDIQHPNNQLIKEKIFNYFDIPLEADYDTLCQKHNLMNRQELLEYIKTL